MGLSFETKNSPQAHRVVPPPPPRLCRPAPLRLPQLRRRLPPRRRRQARPPPRLRRLPLAAPLPSGPSAVVPTGPGALSVTREAPAPSRTSTTLSVCR